MSKNKDKSSDSMKIPVVLDREPTAQELQDEYERGEQAQYEFVLKTIKRG